jgi:hypothetical protein
VAVQLEIDVSQKLIIATFSGEVTDADVLGLASKVHSHPDFDPSLSILWDFSGVTAGTVSTAAMRELSWRKSILSPASMHVIIAPQDHIFGLFRMGEVFAQKTKPNVVVVRTLEEARKFLGSEKAG